MSTPAPEPVARDAREGAPTVNARFRFHGWQGSTLDFTRNVADPADYAARLTAAAAPASWCEVLP